MEKPNLTSVLTLGEKIRNIRKEKRISQFDLELKIGAAFGSISRLENNLVKPTKETLSKISRALELKPSQTADLLGLKIFSPEELIAAINKISESLDLETTLQTAVDIIFDLYPNYIGGVIFLKNGNFLRSKTISNTPNVNKALTLFPTPFSKLKVSLKTNLINLGVKSVLLKRNFQSTNPVDFTRGAINDIVIKIMQKITGFSIGITIPIIFNKKVFGVALYSKKSEESFSIEEEKILVLLTKQLAIAINNAQKFRKLSNSMKIHKKILTNTINQ
ncbi:MAG TPA: helix-turn-helix domain-containing protein [Candidatus Dojkabacteria bacterium]|nr:helix-turn-helix domain-containing protein [Candidatus Dojkabacteria bacterium]